MNAKALDVAATVLTRLQWRGPSRRGSRGGAPGGAQLHGGRKAKSSHG